jgi:hypothetical protein
MADRRQHPRFEPSGVLCGTLELSCPVRLKEVSPAHVVVEGILASDLKWLRFAKLIVNNSGNEIEVVVRHLRPLTTSSRNRRCLIERKRRYLIDLDLVTASSKHLVHLRRILGNRQPGRLPS